MVDDAPSNGRKPDGRFAKGTNANNKNGRIKGSRNKVTMAMQALLDGEGEALTHRCIQAAHAGDATAMKICLDRLLPPRKDAPVNFDLPDMTSDAGPMGAMHSILAAVAAGEVTPDEATSLGRLVEVFVRAKEVTEFDTRLRALEAASGEIKQ